MQLVSSIQG